MDNNSSYEIVAVGEIIVKNSTITEKYNENIEFEIEKIWNEESNLKDSLFDDKVLSLVKINKNYDVTEIIGKFISYKAVLAARKKPTLRLEINPIGVSGMITFVENNEKYVIFSNRDTRVTEYVEGIELVPSGHLDISVLKESGIIDYKAKIKDEFCEETGLSINRIKNLHTMCLVKDLRNNVFDICCLIEITVDRNNIIESFKKTTEYSEPILIKIRDLEDFVSKNFKKIIPTSLGIIDYYLSNFKNK